MIAEDARISRSRQQVSTDLRDGETVLLNLRDGAYYGLNAMGSRIWDLLETPRTVGELRGQLVAEFAVEPARCQRELQVLLDELATCGLIEVGRGK